MVAVISTSYGVVFSGAAFTFACVPPFSTETTLLITEGLRNALGESVKSLKGQYILGRVAGFKSETQKFDAEKNSRSRRLTGHVPVRKCLYIVIDASFLMIHLCRLL